MNSVSLLALGGWLAIATSTSAIGAEATNQSFAVIELFSSEGCSSCPPADKVLSEFAAAAKHDGRRIFPLEFHVDYWNRLGWTDPFSSPAFSQRQQQYADAWKSSEIYTPQMIVNGTEQFSGADRARAAEAVAAALAQPAGVLIELQAEQRPDGWQIGYQVNGAPRDTAICLALVESGLTSQVRRGENSGRTLTHANVVRDFTSQPLPDNGAGEVALKMQFTPASTNLQAIAFVQNPRTMAILGAANLGLTLRFFH